MSLDVTESQFSASELAEARFHTYRLLAGLIREPVSAENRPILKQIPDFADTLPSLTDPAVQHQTLLGFELYPHASIFLDESGLIGGTIADELIRIYQDGGFQWLAEPDHLANQLAYLSHLSGAEADAIQDQLPLIVARMRTMQAKFLTDYLLPWLPNFVIALEQQGQPFYAAMAKLLWTLANQHALTLECYPTGITPSTPPNLEDEKTSLRDIATFLLRPVQCGWWLSAGNLNQIGRKLNLPRGFGGRQQTLNNLFRSASQYDLSAELITELQTCCQTAVNHYQELEQPQFATDWLNKCRSTEKLLEEMHHFTTRLAPPVEAAHPSKAPNKFDEN